MPTLTNKQLADIYERSCNVKLSEPARPQMHAFLTMLFNELPTAGFIDETNDVAFDAFMLSGEKVGPLYPRPELESLDAPWET